MSHLPAFFDVCHYVSQPSHGLSTGAGRLADVQEVLSTLPLVELLISDPGLGWVPVIRFC